MNIFRFLIIFCLCFSVLLSAQARNVMPLEQLEMSESLQLDEDSHLPQFPLKDIMAAIQLLNVPGDYQELKNSYEAPELLRTQESHNLLHTNLPPPPSIL